MVALPLAALPERARPAAPARARAAPALRKGRGRVRSSTRNRRTALDGGEIVITPPQTEQRARTALDGIFAGSTRKTERHSGQETFTTVSRANCLRRAGDAGHAARLAVRPAVDRVDRARERLGVALHFCREFADLCRMREVTPLVRHDADGDRHERHPMQLSAPVLAEEIARAPVLLGILIRDRGDRKCTRSPRRPR